ncbi:ADP,ATP carrier protein 1 [Orientia chuto str. Dubai]|uniref:ADP,ATP carrier protein n=1 Tax=Orientia chuto str. Dubai TaxID=1359168 RepID=A0A0F3MN60_9RICK|nr:Npt1/Npt2 family nucleotide transporter [Candidatus Orientia mediorientalis]KJV56907.1 ADP,ATP carrier protein 1 [Orientia chuto str. Dubai]
MKLYHCLLYYIPSLANISRSISLNFSKIFNHIWPVHRCELPRFLLMTALMFCILLIQNLIRALKDSIVITMIGTETTSFLKIWGVLPAACLMTIVYIKLVNVVKNEKVFYIILLAFLIFFFAFGFVIFPNYQYLHLNDQSIKKLIFQFPNFRWIILMLAKWSFSLFYIIAELWPNAVFSLLYWQFVNMVTTVEQSRRFYVLFSLFGQTGLYISGTLISFLPSLSNYFINNYDLQCSKTTIYIQIIMGIVLLLGGISMVIFAILNAYIIKIDDINFKVKSNKMSIFDGIKIALESRYIRLVITLLICYGVAINLVEAPWKYKAGTLYHTPEEYNAFVGSYLSYTGICTILFVLVGSNIVRYCGWKTAAMITPIMLSLTGIVFFIASSFDTSFSSFFELLWPTIDPLNIAITTGVTLNILTKSSKYTFFDSTKEMAYVPLNNELKSKGKATADVMGVKLGKSASALVQSLIFMLIPTATYQSITPYLMLIFIVICIVWMLVIRELNKEYLKLTNSTYEM